MPTIFSHAFFATAIGRAAFANHLPLRFWLLTALCAILPDADVIGFSFGVRDGSMLGHRGFTHSILFAFSVGALVAALAFRNVRIGLSRATLFGYFLLVTLSHPLLDMFTDGGSGVALFAPFSTRRYFFPWRPVEASPIGMRFFGDRGLDVIASEMIWVWLPALVILGVAAIMRRLRRAGKAA